jgi:hypothetical protein
MAPPAFTGLLGVEESKDLLRVYDALKHYPEDVQSRTLSAATQQLAAGWEEELAARPGYSAATKAVIAANPTSVAHTLGLTVATGGSGPLAALTRPFEFGTLSQDEYRSYTRRSPSGVQHTVKRRTQRQIPTRSTGGWVAYPAAGKWSTRAFKMFMQIIVKVAHDAIDGGR